MRWIGLLTAGCVLPWGWRGAEALEEVDITGCLEEKGPTQYVATLTNTGVDVQITNFEIQCSEPQSVYAREDEDGGLSLLIQDADTPSRATKACGCQVDLAIAVPTVDDPSNIAIYRRSASGRKVPVLERQLTLP
ncbi:MAG: hypothetical protein AAGA48_31330 [Myxococcota bacterium]